MILKFVKLYMTPRASWWISSKESACNDAGLIPEVGKSLAVGIGNPLQYPCLENPTDKGAWWATVHGVTRVRQNLVTKPPPPTALQEKQPNLTTNTKNEML